MWSNLLNFANPRAPKGLIRDAQAWTRERNVRESRLRDPQPAAWSREVFPAEESRHPMAYAYAAGPHDEFGSIRWTQQDAASLYYLRGGRLLGADGAVISPDNRVFAQFTLPPGRDWLEHSCFRRRRVPAVRTLAGWYATIAWPEAGFFFHWMMEALPRMAVLGDHADLLDGLFVPGPLQRFHVDSLARLGIAESKLIALDAQSHYAPQHLFVPHSFAMYNPPTWMGPWYRDKFLDPQDATREHPARRLYVSRADAPHRPLENEDEVLRLLEPLGFEAVTLSRLSFMEQARLFADAGCVVAPHGAGLSHLVFCRPGTQVLEILPPRWMAPCFTALAGASGCHYRHVVAHEIERSGGRPQTNPIRVPMRVFEATLAELMA